MGRDKLVLSGREITDNRADSNAGCHVSIDGICVRGAGGLALLTTTGDFVSLGVRPPCIRLVS